MRLSFLKVTVFVFALLCLQNSHIYSQSCSCGGPPLLGALESGYISNRVLQVGLTYEYSSIDDLIAGTKELENLNRLRNVNSIIFQVNYGLTSRISLAFSSSLIEQERNINIESGVGENLQTQGLGDLLLTGRYTAIPFSIAHRFSLTLGAGIKIPTGTSTLKNNNLLISADMQPGTGSTDGIISISISKDYFSNYPITFFSFSVYRFNGTNNRFGGDFESYKFGNEISLVGGIKSNIFNSLEYTLALRYRHQEPDQFASENLPSSGGNWLNISPGINILIGKTLTFRTSGQIPLYREVQGTQFSTNYTISFSLFYNLLTKGNNDELL